MEQYQMPKEMDFINLRKCIDNFEADWLYIRLVGSHGGTTKVNENLKKRDFDFYKDDSKFCFLIDSEEVFCFTMEDYNSKYTKGFGLAYERFDSSDEIDKIICLPTGIDPYDKELPEPRRSFLRNVLDYHLLEVFFNGRIPIKFHSWWKEPYWKYWTIDDNKLEKKI